MKSQEPKEGHSISPDTQARQHGPSATISPAGSEADLRDAIKYFGKVEGSEDEAEVTREGVSREGVTEGVAQGVADSMMDEKRKKEATQAEAATMLAEASLTEEGEVKEGRSDEKEADDTSTGANMYKEFAEAKRKKEEELDRKAECQAKKGGSSLMGSLLNQ